MLGRRISTGGGGGGGGTSQHDLLTNLGYAAAGHTGFVGITTVQTITGQKTFQSTVRTIAGLIPTISGTGDIGSALLPYGDVYATNFYGDGSNLTGISGVSDHSSLTQLDYASAGHTGFMPIAGDTFTGDVTWATGIDILAAASGTSDIGTLNLPFQNIYADNLYGDGSNLTGISGAGVSDHGALTGLGDDDHTQYHNNTRGDARYYTQTELVATTTDSGSGANLIGVPTLSGATIDTVGDVLSLVHSAGRATGGSITDAGGETVNVAAGTGFIKATDNDTTELVSFDWAASNGVAAPSGVNYIGVKYNSGAPVVDIRSTENHDLDTAFPLGKVVNEGGTLHILNNPWWVTDGITNVLERFQGEGHVVRDKHVGGIALSVPGTRNIAVTAGMLWSRLNEFPVNSSDTTVTGTVELYWRDSGNNWTDSHVSQYPVNQYNDITLDVLQNLSNNNYANWWVYVEVDDDEVALVYPQHQYSNIASAEVESPPSSIPVHISENGILIGRIIIKQGVDAPVQVDTAWEAPFTPSQAADHGNLAGLGDDDHTQYHNDARGDARYVPKTGGTFTGDVFYEANNISGTGTVYTRMLNVEDVPSTNQTATGGISTIMTVDANATGFGAALHMDTDGNWVEADASTSSTMPCQSLALEAGTGPKEVLMQGFVRDDGWTWTVGATIYVGDSAGDLVQITPSGSGDKVQAVGFATHADRMYFNPDYTLIEIA